MTVHKFIYLSCDTDRCKNKFRPSALGSRMGDRTAVRAQAVAAGWETTLRRDLCPFHIAGAEPVQPEVTP